MRRIVITAAAATLLLTSCGDSNNAATQPDTPSAKPSTTTPQNKQVPWGKPAEVTGTGGHKLRITPTGVLYHRGPYKGVDGPENGWFAAISLRVEAVDQADAVLAGAGNGGLQWKGNGQTITNADSGGNAPWVGAVNQLGGDSPIQPRRAELAVETFDIPARGGWLGYANPDGSLVEWNMPVTDQGSMGLAKVRAKIREFS
ncbi:hypothetical protein ACQEU3_46680 [Spirillospora sp. CA-253888]